MSNLKKILSLVMAVAMILSFATSAMAGAFFDVKDEDDYADAINLLASLEVLLGFEDGSYQPSGTYTREQFAKILYVLMTGKDDNANMYAGASPFPDVASDRWSAGYITWATNLGVINGREDGLFYPTDVVKYAEAAKMFIVAMGYSSSIYSYPYGFIDKAQTLGMFDDLAGYSTFGDANRGTVAQMAYNCLFAEAPRFGTYTTQEGNSTNTNTYTVIEGAFGVRKASGYRDSDNVWHDYVLSGTSTKAYGAPLYDDDQVYINDEVYDYVGEVDAYIGEPVQIWFKPPSDKDTFGTDSDLILIERLTSVKSYIVNPMDIDTDRSSSESLYFTDGNVTRRMRLPHYTVGTTDHYGIAPIGFDGKEQLIFSHPDDVDGNAKYDDSASREVMQWLDFYPDNDTQKSAVYKFIDYTGDGVADAVYVDVPDFAKVTSTNSTRITVNAGALIGSNTFKDDDGNTVITAYDGIAKDDRVLVYHNQAVLSGSVEDTYNIVKAESVLNTKHNSVSGSRYFFDSVRYRLTTKAGTVKLGDSYDLYLNANGYVMEAEKVSGASNSNWILLTSTAHSHASGGKLTAASLTGYTSDGVKRTYLLDLDEIDEDIFINGFYDENDDWVGAGTGPAAANEFFNADTGWADGDVDGNVAGYGRLFAYTLSSNNEIDSLEHLYQFASDDDDITDAIYGSAAAEYDEDTNLLKAAGKSIYLSGDTVIFNKYEGSKVAVLKLSDMPDFSTGKGNTVIDVAIESGDANVMVITSEKKIGTSSNRFGLIISASRAAGSSNKFFYDMEVAMGNEVQNIRTKEVAAGGSDGITNRLSEGGPVKGYAKLTLDASGECTAIEWLGYGSDPVDFNDGKAESAKVSGMWVHGAVNSKSSSGRGLNVSVFDSTSEYTWTAGKDHPIVTGLNDQNFTLDSECAFFFVDTEPFNSFAGIGEPGNGSADFTLTDLVDDYVAFPNDEDVDPASVDSMTMSSTNSAWMVDLIIEDDEDSNIVVAVFVYSVPVRTAY